MASRSTCLLTNHIRLAPAPMLMGGQSTSLNKYYLTCAHLTRLDIWHCFSRCTIQSRGASVVRLWIGQAQFQLLYKFCCMLDIAFGIVCGTIFINCTCLAPRRFYRSWIPHYEFGSNYFLRYLLFMQRDVRSQQFCICSCTVKKKSWVFLNFHREMS